MQSSATSQTHPSPQRTPVLFQAGSSASGKAFGTKHAKAVFCGAFRSSDLAAMIKAMRENSASVGRDPTELKFSPQISPILGRTVEEAQGKWAQYKTMIDYRAGLATISTLCNIDFLYFPEDVPFDLSGLEFGAAGVHTIIETAQTRCTDPITPKLLGEITAFSGFAPMPVGTPKMVADEMKKWLVEADIDGFNVAYVVNPGSYQDVVDLLVPELQRRKLMWDDYAVPGGTFREHLHRRPGAPLLPEEHTGAQFRYEKLKKFADVNGDFTITKL